MSDVLLVETVAPHVRLIKLNRPEQLNAITAELCASLHLELERASADRSCRVIMLTGEGRGFCAGLDLRGYGQAPGTTAPTRRATISTTSSTCRGCCCGFEPRHSP